MTYRDDHEAALARVDALEQELRREQGDDAERERRIAELERELAEARRKLERAEAVLADVKKTVPEPEPEPPMRSAMQPPALEEEPPVPTSEKQRIVLFAIPALLILMFIAIVAAAGSKSGESDDTAPPRPAPPAPVVAADQIAGFLAEAQARAANGLPGGALVAIHAEGVTRDGSLNREYGKVTFEFERADPPQAYHPDPDTPIGAPYTRPSDLPDFHCLNLEFGAYGYRESAIDSICMNFSTTARSASTPVCSMRNVWDMALADGAPANAIARIDFEGSWRFLIDDPRASFDHDYRDDCRAAERGP